ncbi:Metallo-beta-lactamase family protein [Fulvivirga imtechensis AK7]|uniref:Metallo-beta-lactamase family protein n=1 Tax=Fulvivirga imtechensis AK7 TaxID=1237149 RepID=L8K0J6_9BACT|nr:MBL fold metallo-hydrolase [Fulvivirga imtechensis]ELR73454.1 Metallo-beta-lactamase family protein [Fulvivirga imtechensis AK7]
MKIEQIYTGCLAEAAYYIESNGEAAIIDPLREVKPYIEKAEENGAKIKYVLETHFHADFVSGHIDLAKKTGGVIVYGPTAQPGYDAHIATDGEILPLGNIKIKVLHTPGHTMESSTYLLIDEEGDEKAIFTGDTLFIGDVGRPDLAVKTDLTREDLAGHLFESLRKKIMPLSDDIIVYPGHGAGSACGKNMSAETTDTLGNQKQFNYALRPDMTKEEFIKEVTTGLVEPPQYFPKNAVMNKMGYESIDEVLERGIIPLDVEQFESTVEVQDAMILDTRSKEDFVKGFVPGSVWIGIEDKFAPWVGALITDLKQPIVFIADKGREEEVVTRLSRVGYDNTLGYLEGGVEAWEKAGKPVDKIDEIGPHDFTNLYDTEKLNVLDVRKQSEYESQHIEGAINFPLDFINRNMSKINRDTHYFLHCQGGYRSVIASSILKARGFKNITNIRGGFNEIKKSCIKVTEYHTPETML